MTIAGVVLYALFPYSSMLGLGVLLCVATCKIADCVLWMTGRLPHP